MMFCSDIPPLILFSIISFHFCVVEKCSFQLTVGLISTFIPSFIFHQDSTRFDETNTTGEVFLELLNVSLELMFKNDMMWNPSSKAIGWQWVWVFVCLFLNSSKTAASIKLNISGNIPLYVHCAEGFRLKNIPIQHPYKNSLKNSKKHFWYNIN